MKESELRVLEASLPSLDDSTLARIRDDLKKQAEDPWKLGREESSCLSWALSAVCGELHRRVRKLTEGIKRVCLLRTGPDGKRFYLCRRNDAYTIVEEGSALEKPVFYQLPIVMLDDDQMPVCMCRDGCLERGVNCTQAVILDVRAFVELVEVAQRRGFNDGLRYCNYKWR